MGGESAAAGRVLSPVDNFGRIPCGLLLGAGVTDAERVAYAYLTTWDMGRSGRMFCGREKMAEDLGWSVRKVDKALLALERRDAIRRIRRGLGQTNDIELLADVTVQSRNMVRPGVAQYGDPESPNEATLKSHDGATPITRENTRENTREKGVELPLDLPPPVEINHARARKRDPIFDSLARVFPANTEGERKQVAAVTRDLQKLDPPPTPEMVERVARAVVADYPDAAVFQVTQKWTRLSKRIARRDSPAAQNRPFG